MSQYSSTVVTIECDVSDCKNQQVHVKTGEISQTDSDWGRVELGGKRDFDLCPYHLKQFEELMWGGAAREMDSSCGGCGANPYEECDPECPRVTQ